MFKFRKKVIILFQIFFILTLFSNCSNKSTNDIIEEVSDAEIYENGLSYLKKSNYEKAAIEFDKLFINYPFSSLASNAEIMTAYSLFQNNEIKRAISKLEEFIELNPSGELSKYAQYLLAMSYYIQISNEGRDTRLSEKALEYFQMIISKYPDSKYAKDAKLKIEYINNSLAQNELLVGVYYLKNNSPISSIKRFKSIIKNYKNTAVIPETLYRLCEAFLMIGLKQEAIKSSSLLSYNFPANNWTKLSKKIIKDSSKLEKNNGLLNSINNYVKNIFD